MRRQLSFLILLFFCIFAEATSAQLNVWRWQNPPIQGNTLQSVQMISLSTTYACGNDATFMRTSDGGATWDLQERLLNLQGRNFFSLSFLDANFGMMCGDSGKILKTYDGGSNWVILPTNTEIRFNSIAVIDTNIAIVVGDVGNILRTTDGGNTWVSVPFELKATFRNVRKLNSKFITIVGNNGLIYESNDKGQSWSQIPLQVNGVGVTNNLYGQVFTDIKHGTVIGIDGMILHTSDAGYTWERQLLTDSIFLTATLNAIDGKDPNILAMVGDYGTIVTTTDAGTHWTRVRVSTQDSLHAISFFDNLNATAVGRDGIILRTSDGGASWRFLPKNPQIDGLYGVAFPKGDTSLGIAVGNFGAILRTTNGGAQWDYVSSGTSREFLTVAFLDPKTVIAAGQFGAMIRSNDGGLTWHPLASSTNQNIHSLSFPTPSFGWAVGDSGLVMSTTDGGLSWKHHEFDDALLFSGITFSDSLHGYLGSYGFTSHGLFITTDGGENWDNPDTTHFDKIYGISSPSPNVVAVCGYICTDRKVKGRISVSHDGGKTHVASFAGSPSQMLAIFFCDDLHGTVIGASGLVFHTSDGGTTWRQQLTSAKNLFGVCFGNRKAGNVVGERGQILRITTDE